jgi:flavin-binding protein dodecin
MRNGLARAAMTLRHMDWFEVEGIRGRLEEGQIAHVQVTMKVGFRLDDPAGPGGE